MLPDADWAPPRFRSFPEGHRPPTKDPITPQQRLRWQTIPSETERRANLLVAGGGLSGVGAALAATRRGLNAIIVEPTHMVGGQATAAGVSAFDITFQYDEAINDHGIWGDIVARILDVYHEELQRPANVGHYRDGSLTPNVVIVERVLSDMLDEAGVEVLRNTAITGARHDAGRVSGLETTAGVVLADVVVDATEDGHVLALAGVPHRIGNRQSNGTTTRPSDPQPAKIQDITVTAVIRAYPEGVPEELMLQEPPAGWEQRGPVLAKVFPPAGVMDRQDAAKEGPLGFAGYRAAPDLASDNMHTGVSWREVSRTSLNYFNDLPVNTRYLTDPATRLRNEATAILRTLCIIYHLQHVLGLPWSVATDEGFADGPTDRHNPHVPDQYRTIEAHLPLIPYIREGRRLMGVTTLTGKMLDRFGTRGFAAWRPDSIATGTYHPDLHGGRREVDFEHDLGESEADKPTRLTFGPFPIPLGSLIPEWVDGFLAAEKNISASRLGSSGVRVHPTVTGIGEAVGVLVALAVRKGVQPREVPVDAVQYELARGGALITSVCIEGVPRQDKDYPLVALAATQDLVETVVVNGPPAEQRLRVDRGAALASVSDAVARLRKQGFLLD